MDAQVSCARTSEALECPVIFAIHERKGGKRGEAHRLFWRRSDLAPSARPAGDRVELYRSTTRYLRDAQAMRTARRPAALA